MMEERIKRLDGCIRPQIKGNVKIWLHNHNSGFTELYERENMVTDGLGIMLRNLILMNAAGDTKTYPFYSTLLGSIYLFDDTLTEDEENFLLPSDSHLVGWANQTVDTSNIQRGSLNMLESGPTANGFKTVWDFSTSQCNSTINALARTYKFGDHPLLLGINVGRPQFAAGFDIPLYYDEETRMLYAISSSASQNNWTVYKVQVNISDIGVLDTFAVRTPEVVRTISTSDLPSRVSWYRMDEDFLQGIYVPSVSGGSDHFNVYKMKYSDFSFDVELDNTVTCEGALFQTNSIGVIMGNKALIFHQTSTNKVYLVDLENTADIEEIEVPTAINRDAFETNVNSNGLACLMTGRVSSYGSIGGRGAFLYPDGTVVEMDANPVGWYSYQLDSGANILDRYGLRFYNRTLCFKQDILGTICNLASPITKTPATSMKIEYTLTDVSE